jgi:hypothetical protein
MIAEGYARSMRTVDDKRRTEALRTVTLWPGCRPRSSI